MKRTIPTVAGYSAHRILSICNRFVITPTPEGGVWYEALLPAPDTRIWIKVFGEVECEVRRGIALGRIPGLDDLDEAAWFMLVALEIAARAQFALGIKASNPFDFRVAPVLHRSQRRSNRDTSTE